jgi:hypothetical protein
MRRLFIVGATALLLQLLVLAAFAQSDKLLGKWEGTIKGPQGDMPTTATFKKEGETVVGSMPSMRPGTELQLKDIKVEGNKVTAKADVETPQGSLTINYSFTLEGDTLNGQGSLNFGGQDIAFDLNLKRAAGAAPSTPATGQGQGAGQGQGQGQGAGQGAGQGQGQGQQRTRVNVPQPQQKQSIDYFVGQWSYKYVGRESALGPAPRDCVVTFTKRPDGKSVEGVTDCKYDGGTSKSTSILVFDEATKMVTHTQKLPVGVILNSKGDWSSPISIRFTVEPMKIKGQSLQLRRTISIVAAHSFTVAEELSEDGGPFVRLGNAVFSKVGAQ